MSKYRITYDFDAEGEPPKVFIVGAGVRVEVDELPACKTGGRLVETTPGTYEWQDPWSWEETDWGPGPIAARLLAVMNEHM